MPDPDDRLTELRSRWEADPGSRVFVQLAEEYRNQGRLEEAVEVLESGLAKAPAYVSAQVALGRCRLELGHVDSAVSALERVVERDATQLVANKLLVEAYLRQGAAEKARRRLDLYRTLNDADPQVEDLEQALAEVEARRAAVQASSKEGLLMEVGDEPDETERRPADLFDRAGESGAAVEGPRSESANLADPFPELHSREDRFRYERALGAEGLFRGEDVVEEAAPGPVELEAAEVPGPESVLGVREDEGVETSSPPQAAASDEPFDLAAEPVHPESAAEGLFDLEPPRPVRTDMGQIFELPPMPVAVGEELSLDASSAASSVEVRYVFPEVSPSAEDVAAIDGAVDETADEGLPQEEPEPAMVLEAFEPEEPAFEAPSEALEEAPMGAAAPEPFDLADDDTDIAVEEEAELRDLDVEAQPVTATLGQLYLQQGHPELAQRIFRKVLAEEPGHPVALAGLATIDRGTEESHELVAADLLQGPEAAAASGLTERKLLLLKNYLGRIKARA